jgi:IS1 family transposase
MISMNKLSNSEQATVIRALVEGNSIASTVRMTGIAKTTILRLMVAFSDACQKFHDEQVKGLTSKRIQMDEVWAFIGAKEKNASFEKKAKLQWGDAWTWTAIDADTKLMVSWLIGPRHAGSANSIMHDVSWRLTHRIQLTTDGLHAYWDAAINAFNCEVDYAQLIKMYGPDTISGKYSPSEVTGIEIKERMGNCDPKHISTSYVERSNLSVRMGMRRYTRLTNGHSKKFENHVAMSTIWFTYYNWCRIHQTLRVTPAMQAGLTNKLWEIEDLIDALLK